MSKPAATAVVRYLGIVGTFRAVIHEINGVNVVQAEVMDYLTANALTATRDDFIAALDHDEETYLNATHHIWDFPNSGFWRPDLGVFVVPGDQVTEVRKRRQLPNEHKLKR